MEKKTSGTTGRKINYKSQEFIYYADRNDLNSILSLLWHESNYADSQVHSAGRMHAIGKACYTTTATQPKRRCY